VQARQWPAVACAGQALRALVVAVLSARWALLYMDLWKSAGDICPVLTELAGSCWARLDWLVALAHCVDLACHCLLFDAGTRCTDAILWMCGWCLLVGMMLPLASFLVVHVVLCLLARLHRGMARSR
jgi:hypothetical protein